MSASLQIPSNRLGETLRVLMTRRGLSGQNVAECVGITPASYSRILTGTVRPRQGTFTKLFKTLATNAQEEQMLLSSYSDLPDQVAEDRSSPVGPNGEVPASELDRVARYLEMKALAIDFKKSVAQNLRDAGVDFLEDLVAGPVVTDFLVKDVRVTAIECKFNVNRDWEREVAAASLLKLRLPCDRVLIVVPFHNELSMRCARQLALAGDSVLQLSELVASVKGAIK